MITHFELATLLVQCKELRCIMCKIARHVRVRHNFLLWNWMPVSDELQLQLWSWSSFRLQGSCAGEKFNVHNKLDYGVFWGELSKLHCNLHRHFA